MYRTYTQILAAIILALVMPCTATAGRQKARVTWHSPALKTVLGCTISCPDKAARDAEGKSMTIVYLENLACTKIGRYSNKKNVRWLLDKGYKVIEIDYRHHPKATAPHLNADIMALNDTLAKGRFGNETDISDSRCYILFEGYRIERDVSYCLDDPTVYNYPDCYATQPGDSLYMDIVYPANAAHGVPVILSFSYSNSYAGTANEGCTERYKHRRMFLGYTLAMFDDTILEGSPAAGMAWAIADHPKYCDWGRGNPKGGRQKDYGAVEISDDAARKVRAAIRTLRHLAPEMGMNGKVALYGFSRGSTAASLAIGDKPFDEWLTTEGSRFDSGETDIQAAVLGPGIFDYSLMSKSRNEYRHIDTYCHTTPDAQAAWNRQGGARAINAAAAPTLLFFNTDDDPEYSTQAEHLVNLLRKTETPHTLMQDYGKGHSVPTSPVHISRIYSFLKEHTSD